MNGVDRYMNILLVFWEKNFIWGNLIFLGDFLLFEWAWLKLSQATVTTGSLVRTWFFFMITSGSSQDMIRIYKDSRHDFSGKHLCDGYFMDIMWCLCVKVKIQQRVIWFCIASIIICFISLFECKGPWMLKTDSLIF